MLNGIGKKRFELACYKNKLLEYRSGTETDLDNVLQVPTIFLSVAKAQTAPTAELTKSFGNLSTDGIIQEILRRGEVQVGERERKEMLERVEKEVLDIVSGRLVDPSTKRVYTPGIISKALDQLSSGIGQQQQQHAAHEQGHGHGEADSSEQQQSQQRKPIWTGVSNNKSAKIQALDAMKALIAWQPIPVMRARMRLRITCPVSLLKQTVKTGQQSTPTSTPTPTPKDDDEGGGKKGGGKKAKGRQQKQQKQQQQQKQEEYAESDTEKVSSSAKKVTLKDKVLSYIESIETEEVVGGDEWDVVGFVQPGAFRVLNEFVGHETRGRGRVEVLDMAVTQED